MQVNNPPPRFAYFGTPEFASIILDELEAKGFIPTVVVTAPDKPKGRKLILTQSEVKVWTTARNIPVLSPEKIRGNQEFLETLKGYACELFIVAAYGKIIPKEILDIPKHSVLNVHPSLLPKFRGSSPIESAILSDETYTGVSIMELDEEMDHGPLIAQEEYHTEAWPPKGSMLTKILAREGGKLLAHVIPEWITRHHKTEQDHSKATFTKKITKEDGLLDITGDALLNYKKIKAFDEWPGAYFFTERNGKTIRVRVNDAEYKDGTLTITRVTPEGKKEMNYVDFLRGAH